MKKSKIIIISLIGVAIFLIAGFFVDHQKQEINNSTDLISSFNRATSSLTTSSAVQAGSISFTDYGPAPDFQSISNWLNSEPLTISALKGRVVLIDFWTYSCINCIRTLPYVTKWFDNYRSDGLVIVGVHTPEFAFEKDAGNVANAVKQFGIHYSVAQDNNYATWTAYNNDYWPAEYLIDKTGQIVYEHFGEGNYDHTENAIRELLGLNVNQLPASSTLGQIGSPEMYFGTARLANLTPDQSPSLTPFDYTIKADPVLNNFALGGQWQFSQQNITLASNQGEIRLKFHSAKVYIVASSNNPAALIITVDGRSQVPVTVTNAQLYTLFSSSDYFDHILDIKITGSGFEGFTFTFG